MDDNRLNIKELSNQFIDYVLPDNKEINRFKDIITIKNYLNHIFNSLRNQRVRVFDNSGHTFESVSFGHSDL